MYDAIETKVRWSVTLARALVRSLPDDRVRELSKTCEDQTIGERLPADWREAIIERSTEDRSLQCDFVRAWRKLHSDLVVAAQFTSIDGPAQQCEAMIQRFGAEAVLIELITDEHDDGWSLAEWTVDNVQSDDLRFELKRILETWSNKTVAATKPIQTDARKRIVIFGGHQRDESKIHRRVFGNSPFDIRWKPYEKNLGSPNDKYVNESMAHADAVILVTTMVSHNIMRIVKRFTQENKIPLRRISKATEKQLRVVFADLFPDLLLPES